MNILSSINSFQESEALILSEKSISSFMKSYGKLASVKNEVEDKDNYDLESSGLGEFLKNAEVEYKEESKGEGNAVLTPTLDNFSCLAHVFQGNQCARRTRLSTDKKLSTGFRRRFEVFRYDKRFRAIKGYFR